MNFWSGTIVGLCLNYGADIQRATYCLDSGCETFCGAIAAQQRQAGTSAVVVLGGLLEESDRMAGDLAKALERSRIAGITCEAIHHKIRNSGAFSDPR